MLNCQVLTADRVTVYGYDCPDCGSYLIQGYLQSRLSTEDLHKCLLFLRSFSEDSPNRPFFTYDADAFRDEGGKFVKFDPRSEPEE
jgi:hypothetical protein